MLHIFDLFGVVVFAITGALQAGRKRMDVFGAVVIGLVTALGGGTIRDLVLDIRPVFWVGDPTYVLLGSAAAAATFLLAPAVKGPGLGLLIADAFCLAVATMLGLQRAYDAGVPLPIVLIMGVMTGVAGGAMRDLLCGQIPLILQKEIYATAALGGACVFVLLKPLGLDERVVQIATAATVLVIRLSAIYWHLSLPRFLQGRGEH
jgi:uncharacterized membrane protein YeiH